jgi:uncharacterized protein
MPISKKLARNVKKIFWLALTLFFLLNVVTFAAAYAATHFRSPHQWGLMPRPTSSQRPTDLGLEYTTQRIAIASNQWLETWLIPASNKAHGTVLLFPGNGGSKAKQLLAPAQAFHELGYDTLLTDFRGGGGSSGSTTTLGIKEATDVALVFHEADRVGLQRPYILYGVSMGTAAILKAIAHEKIRPDAIVLELPFARLLDAVRVRLRAVPLPSFPGAELLVFWASVQHGVNGFGHNPVHYASQVKCPTLILHGKLDKWMSVAAVQQIVHPLPEPKQLVIFPQAGHDLLVTVDKAYWKESIGQFLSIP